MIKKAGCRPIGQPEPPGGFRAPEWAGAPPRPASLQVLKDGQVIQSIPLQQPATLFGRSSSFTPLSMPFKGRRDCFITQQGSREGACTLQSQAPCFTAVASGSHLQLHAIRCRSPAADVVLDHPSLSRQHAAVCYNRLTGQWVILDLNSAHGTTADGRPVTKVRRFPHCCNICAETNPWSCGIHPSVNRPP